MQTLMYPDCGHPSSKDTVTTAADGIVHTLGGLPGRQGTLRELIKHQRQAG